MLLSPAESLDRDVAVIVLDHPEVEPFKEDDVIADSVRFERPSPLAGCGFDDVDCLVEVGDGIAGVGSDELPPVHQGKGDLVRSCGADPVGCPKFGDKLPDECDIVFVKPFLFNGTPDRCIGVFRFDEMERPRCLGWWCECFSYASEVRKRPFKNLGRESELKTKGQGRDSNPGRGIHSPLG